MATSGRESESLPARRTATLRCGSQRPASRNQLSRNDAGQITSAGKAPGSFERGQRLNGLPESLLVRDEALSLTQRVADRAPLERPQLPVQSHVGQRLRLGRKRRSHDPRERLMFGSHAIDAHAGGRSDLDVGVGDEVVEVGEPERVECQPSPSRAPGSRLQAASRPGSQNTDRRSEPMIASGPGSTRAAGAEPWRETSSSVAFAYASSTAPEAPAGRARSPHRSGPDRHREARGQRTGGGLQPPVAGPLRAAPRRPCRPTGPGRDRATRRPRPSSRSPGTA